MSCMFDASVKVPAGVGGEGAPLLAWLAGRGGPCAPAQLVSAPLPTAGMHTCGGDAAARVAGRSGRRAASQAGALPPEFAVATAATRTP